MQRGLGRNYDIMIRDVDGDVPSLILIDSKDCSLKA